MSAFPPAAGRCTSLHVQCAVAPVAFGLVTDNIATREIAGRMELRLELPEPEVSQKPLPVGLVGCTEAPTAYVAAVADADTAVPSHFEG